VTLITIMFVNSQKFKLYFVETILYAVTKTSHSLMWNYKIKRVQIVKILTTLHAALSPAPAWK